MVGEEEAVKEEGTEVGTADLQDEVALQEEVTLQEEGMVEDTVEV